MHCLLHTITTLVTSMWVRKVPARNQIRDIWKGSLLQPGSMTVPAMQVERCRGLHVNDAITSA